MAVTREGTKAAHTPVLYRGALGSTSARWAARARWCAAASVASGRGEAEFILVIIFNKKQVLFFLKGNNHCLLAYPDPDPSFHYQT